MNNEKDLESNLLDMSMESALAARKKVETNESFPEQVQLLKNACEGIDILNLRSGLFTNTAIAKVKDCREILQINGQKWPDKKILVFNKYLDRIDKILQQKVRYGQKLSKYLENKENSVVDQVRSALLQDDLDKYAKIQKTLVLFKVKLVANCDRMLKHLPKKTEKNEQSSI